VGAGVGATIAVWVGAGEGTAVAAISGAGEGTTVGATLGAGVAFWVGAEHPLAPKNNTQMNKTAFCFCIFDLLKISNTRLLWQ
jgi:hypothetical protein